MLRSVGTWHSTRFKTPCSQPLQPLQMSALLQKTMVLKTKVSPLCGAWTADRAEKDGEAGALPTRGFGGVARGGKGGGCWLGCLLGHIMAADTSSDVRSLRAARPGDSWYSFDLLLGLPFVGYGRTGGLGGEGGVQGAGPVVL